MEKKLYISISEADGEILVNNAGFKRENGKSTELVVISGKPEANLMEKLEAVRLAKAAVGALSNWLMDNKGETDVEAPRY